MKRTIEIITREIKNGANHRYSALELDLDDPNLIELIHQHILIFNFVTKENE